MKKLLIRSIFVLLITFLGLSIFLNFYGFETKKFNNLVENQITNFNRNLSLELDKIKIKLDYSNLNIYFETNNPKIKFINSSIPLDKIKVYLNLKSLFQKQNKIEEVLISSKEVKYDEIKSLIKILKPSNFKSFLLNNVTKGTIKSNANLKFDNELNLISYEIDGYIRNLNSNISKKYDFKQTSFIFSIKKNSGELSNMSGKLNDISFNNAELKYLNPKEITLNLKTNITGDINYKKIDSLLNEKQKKFFTKFQFDYKTNSSHELDLQLDKTYKIQKFNYIIKNSSDFLKIIPNKLIKNNVIQKDIKNIEIKDLKLNLNILESGIKKFSLIGNLGINNSNHEKISIETNFTKKTKSFLVNFNSNEKVNFPILNYSSDLKSTFNVNFNLDILKNSYVIKDFSFIEGKNILRFKKFQMNKKFIIHSLSDFKVVTFNNGEKNNDFEIEVGKKIKISGKTYDASNLVNLLDNKNEKNVLTNLNKEIQISFDNLKNIYNPIYKFNLLGKISKGKFTKIISKGEFENGKYLDISLKKDFKSDKKILEIYSDYPKPLLSNYKFFNDLKGGKLLIYSSFDEESSKSKIKIENFKIINAPAFIKLLSLADLGGMADLVSGDGLSFDDMEIQLEKNNNSLKINELYAIGSSISILMEGFRDDSTNIISLRGTMIPAKNINKILSKIPVVGEIIIPKEVGEGLFGVSFKIKGTPNNLKTTVNPVRTLTPRFIQKALEK
tara:strand:- start:86 stop:2266 length:2181 start_codon:yes stop_codon:yes gene_type:complete